VRTVERHIANIYDKIGASGRAARAAAASIRRIRSRWSSRPTSH